MTTLPLELMTLAAEIEAGVPDRTVDTLIILKGEIIYLRVIKLLFVK